ncbi:MAG: hypothetical protein JRM91_01535 [Nitrososphaerota archaeon]|nr:hypothetical protein [Nitrososphaerota archaeon]MDG6945338.1 hypothetical protein [Nitrososphaerota archaeon]MDG6949079.1 hypothetical protein [Nitrososphaerota archaeon]
MDVRRFKDDLYELAGRACCNDSEEVRLNVFAIADILVNLYRKNLVKINHSALELVCARALIKQGYEVKVEHRLDKILVCDVMGSRGDERLIVEIETGFIPPEAALEPSGYARNRISSKITRYSRYADKFALGTTPSYTLDVPCFFVKPPRDRTREEATQIKTLIDVIYNEPETSMDDLMQARLHVVFVIDVDSANVQEIDAETYDRMALSVLDWHRTVQGLNPR